MTVTAIALSFTSTESETAESAVNQILGRAVEKQFGGWGQRVVKIESISEGFCLKNTPSITCTSPTINVYDVYNKTSKVVTLLKKAMIRVHLEYKNPSPYLPHIEAYPVIKQSLDIALIFDTPRAEATGILESTKSLAQTGLLQPE